MINHTKYVVQAASICVLVYINVHWCHLTYATQMEINSKLYRDGFAVS